MSESMVFKTADLCDAHAGSPGFQIAEPGFLDYGGQRSFSGPISTVRAPEDNSLLKSLKRNEGQRDVEVRFAGVTFRPSHHLYADADGIVTAEKSLS